MSETPITADVFLAQATGLSGAQREAIGNLNLLGAKPYSRWMALARELAERAFSSIPVKLEDIGAQLGLNAAGVFEITSRFGVQTRPAATWRALADQYLANPAVWTSRCAAPIPLELPDEDGDAFSLDAIAGEGYLRRLNGEYLFVPLTPGFTLPGGEGFLERHLNTLQMTPLLVDEVSLPTPGTDLDHLFSLNDYESDSLPI